MNVYLFNSQDVEQAQQLFIRKIQPELLAYYKAISKKHFAFISALEKRYALLDKALEQAKGQSDKIELRREFKKDLLELLTYHGKVLAESGFDKFYADFQNAISKEFGELKRIIHIRETFEGYPIELKGNPLFTVRKVFVNSKRLAVLTLKRSVNFFRRVFRRKPLEVVVCKTRRVLFRSMAKEFVQNQFLNNTKHLFTGLMESQSKGMIAFWKLDEALDVEFQKFLLQNNSEKQTEQKEVKSLPNIFKTVKDEHQALLKEIEEETSKIGVNQFKLLDDAFQKADTLELTHKKFNARNFDKNKQKAKKYFTSEFARWKNTHTALIDDWSVDVEITLLYYAAFDEFYYFTNRVKSHVDSNVMTAFTSIGEIIDTSTKAIVSLSSSKKAARETIARERAGLDSLLIDKTIAKTVEQLTGCFSQDFSELRKEMLALVNLVSSNRGFLKNNGYLRAVNESDVKYISPRELLNFEALPNFRERVNEIETFADTQLDKVRVNLLGIGTVCDFTLESALMMLDQKDGTPKKALETAVNGFERALTHLKNAQAILHDILLNIEKELSKAIHYFNSDILKLKDTGNLYELNLKITHIRAVERTDKYKKRLKMYIVEAIPQIMTFYNTTRTHGSNVIKEFKLYLGIAEPKKYVSFELSEFISQTQATIKKLPFVYQRLYRLNPTDEERFFVNRQKELDMLKKALENWKQNRYITVALIGEKGSGNTSLINYFIKNSRVDIDIINYTLSCKIYTKESYFNLFSGLFGVEKFETNNQIIEFINKSEGTKVVVLENLQHLFLKIVNGFDCMNLFFELMANTMKKILWIGAYTTHSWRYLDKTIHITNYFTNEIYLAPLGQDVMEDIIYKRNRLSGYQIIFMPDDYDLVNKKFINLQKEDQQKYLRKKFFKTLHRISSGNISLAQLYWLQSTQMLADDAIHIHPINEFDISFVKNLTSNELFAMQALILHDGLDLEDFSLVMGKPVSVSRNLLTPMLEKGLLIKPRVKYNINPTIFRPVANYLAMRNFVS